MILVSIKWLFRLCVDILCIFVALMPSIILNNEPLPYVRGFHCKDHRLKYPSKLKASISPENWVAINFVPCFVFALGELVVDPHSFDRTFYRLATTFLLGSFTNNSMTHLAKYYIGQLRPDFLDVCDMKVCKGWIASPECNAPNPLDVTSSRLSFYSFHSSHAMYSMVFTALYVHSRTSVRPRWTYLLFPLVQTNLVLAAASIGYSRVYDNKSHLNDVLLGLLQGALLAVVIIRYLFPDTFQQPEEETVAVKSDEKPDAAAAQVP